MVSFGCGLKQTPLPEPNRGKRNLGWIGRWMGAIRLSHPVAIVPIPIRILPEKTLQS